MNGRGPDIRMTIRRSNPGSARRRRRAVLGGALLCLTGAACATPSPGPDAGSPYGPGWSAAHADGANSDYLPITGPAQVTLAWSRKFDGMINLGATTDDRGRLYLTTSGAGCRLHALDVRTGETIWCSEEPDRLAVASSPLLDRTGAIFLADGSAMRRFDRDGRIVWRTPILGVPLSAQFSPAGDLVFVTHVGVAYVLDRVTGRPTIAPVFLTPDPAFDPADGATACMRGLASCPAANTPAIDLRTGTLFFTFWTPGAEQAGVRAIRIGRSSLSPVWTNDTLPGGSASSPTLSADGARLYLTDNRSNLLALDAATGELIWRVDIGYAADGSPSVSPEGLILPAGGRDGVVIAVQDRGDRGEVAWRRSDLANRGIATQTAGARTYVTIGGERGAADLAVLDTRTGAIMDRDALPGVTLLSVGTTLSREGVVFVPTITGRLHAFTPAPLTVAASESSGPIRDASDHRE